MTRFLVRRIAVTLVTLLLVSVVVFLMARVAGDPRSLLLDPWATEEDWDNLGIELGLDKAVHHQYWLFLTGLLRGDMGDSFSERRPVRDVILERLPATLQLGLSAFAFSLVGGMSLGILGAVRRGGGLDLIGKVIALIGQSAPTFWIGIMLIFFFAVRFEWLPYAGREDWKSFILPSVTFGWAVMAANLRIMRSAMLDELDSEYVKFAKAKGVPGRDVVWKHTLPNALIPPLTMAGLTLGSMVTGSLITETVFAWPGLGNLAWKAVRHADYALLQGVVIIFTMVYLAAALLVDVLYARIDPRIRLG